MCTTSSWSNHGDDGDHVGLAFLTPPTYHKVANNKPGQTTINRQTFGLFCVFVLHCKSNGTEQNKRNGIVFQLAGTPGRSSAQKPPFYTSRSRGRWPRALVQVATEDADKSRKALRRSSMQYSRHWLRWTPNIYAIYVCGDPRRPPCVAWLKSNRSLNLGDAHITPVR